MLGRLKWFGTATGLGGATLLALNIDSSGFGFLLFLANSIAWLAAAIWQRDRPLAWMQAGFIAVNLLGIYRWLIA